MNRIVNYQCNNCGRLFSCKHDCLSHESNCTDRYYLSQNHKRRLKRYIEKIRSQGFEVAVTCTSSIVLVSVVDVAQKQPKNKKH